MEEIVDGEDYIVMVMPAKGSKLTRATWKAFKRFVPGEDCSLCYLPVKELPVVYQCSHYFCKPCSVQITARDKSPKCPLCRETLVQQVDGFTTHFIASSERTITPPAESSSVTQIADAAKYNGDPEPPTDTVKTPKRHLKSVHGSWKPINAAATLSRDSEFLDSDAKSQDNYHAIRNNSPSTPTMNNNLITPTQDNSLATWNTSFAPPSWNNSPSTPTPNNSLATQNRHLASQNSSPSTPTPNNSLMISTRGNNAATQNNHTAFQNSTATIQNNHTASQNSVPATQNNNRATPNTNLFKTCAKVDKTRKRRKQRTRFTHKKQKASPASQPPPSPPTSAYFAVVQIHDERVTEGKGLEYLIEWDGVDPETGKPYQLTWEPKDNITPAALDEWELWNHREAVYEAAIDEWEMWH